MEKIGFDAVVSIETPPIQYDIEELAIQFPFVRFILLKETISLGQQINLAVSELNTPLFFVLWNDLRFVVGGGARRMAERLIHSPNKWGGGRGEGFSKRLCTVPVIQSPRLETIPTLRVPILPRKKEYTRGFIPSREGLRTLYPFDGIGIYDRERFVRMGGFDWTFKSHYWQLMDFGFRAHLWGEEISATHALKLSYEVTPPQEDTSIGIDYQRFYLKNLAPVFRKDCAHLPLRRFPGFLLNTKKNFLSACEDFSEGRTWVHANRFRWRCDPRAVAGLWNPLNAEEDVLQIGRENSA